VRAKRNFVVLFIVLAGCSPVVSGTPSDEISNLRAITPEVPEGAAFYDGCTHNVSYPPEFTPDDMGLLFDSADPQIYFYFNIRRRNQAEENLSPEEMLINVSTGYADRPPTGEIQMVMVEDFLGEELEGWMADFTAEGEMHIRLMVLVRPETLLMDMVKDDVVYELVAQAPEAVWQEWEPRFRVLFDSFHPAECGGV
jgi:hypothetical protein